MSSELADFGFDFDFCFVLFGCFWFSWTVCYSLRLLGCDCFHFTSNTNHSSECLFACFLLSLFVCAGGTRNSKA